MPNKKDETIDQLRSLVESQQQTINEHENEIEKYKEKYESGNISRLINSIERSLAEFPISNDDEDDDSSENLLSLNSRYSSSYNNYQNGSDMVSKLSNIAQMIPRIKDLYDYKASSYKRLSSMNNSLHDTVLKISGSKSPTSPKRK